MGGWVMLPGVRRALGVFAVVISTVLTGVTGTSHAATTVSGTPATAHAIHRHAARTAPKRPAAGDRKLRAAVAATVIARSALPDTCSGTLQADTVYPCSNIALNATDQFTITVPSSPNLLFVELVPAASSGYLYA